MRVIYIRKRPVVTVVVIVSVAIPRSETRRSWRSRNQRQLPIYCVEKDEKVASLTFDAAWGNGHAGTHRHPGEIRCAGDIFSRGQLGRPYPESVKALFDAGHEIMNHSNKHKHMTRLTRDEIIEDIGACNRKIEKITVNLPCSDLNTAIMTTNL